jgi:hypothetical protein
MNVEKGLNRIAIFVGWSGSGLAVMSFFIAIAIIFGDSSDKGILFIVALGAGALCYGTGKLFRWLIEGFTDNAKADSPKLTLFRVAPFIQRYKEVFATESAKKQMFIYALFIIAFTIPIVYQTLVPDGGIDAPYLIGYMFGGGVFILALGLMLTKRASVARTNFLVILGLAAIVWISTSCYKEWGAHKELKESLRDVANIVNMPASAIEIATPPELAHEKAADLNVLGHRDSGAADMAILLKALAEYMRSESAKMSALSERFDASDASFETVLIPMNFIDPIHLTASRNRLQKFQELMIQRQKLISSYLIGGEEIIRAAKLSDGPRETMLKSYNQSSTQVKANYKKLDASQVEIVRATNKILDIAQFGMGRNRVENGTVLFTTQSDLDSYNLNLKRINSFAKDEAEATKSIMLMADKSRDEINRIVNELR